MVVANQRGLRHCLCMQRFVQPVCEIHIIFRIVPVQLHHFRLKHCVLGARCLVARRPSARREARPLCSEDRAWLAMRAAAKHAETRVRVETAPTAIRAFKSASLSVARKMKHVRWTNESNNSHWPRIFFANVTCLRKSSKPIRSCSCIGNL